MTDPVQGSQWCACLFLVLPPDSWMSPQKAGPHRGWFHTYFYFKTVTVELFHQTWANSLYRPSAIQSVVSINLSLNQRHSRCLSLGSLSCKRKETLLKVPWAKLIYQLLRWSWKMCRDRVVILVVVLRNQIVSTDLTFLLTFCYLLSQASLEGLQQF